MHGNDLFKMCIMSVHLCGIMNCFICQTVTGGVSESVGLNLFQWLPCIPGCTIGILL